MSFLHHCQWLLFVLLIYITYIWTLLYPNFAPNLHLCLGFCMEDWPALVCRHQPIRVPGNPRDQLDLDGPASLLIWTNKKKRDWVFAVGGKTVNETFRCRGCSLVFRGTAATFSPATPETKGERELWTWFAIFSWTCWTGLLKTQCTGQFVQLLFAAVSLFFLPVCQNEGFWIESCPQDGYTHRGRAAEAHHWAFGQSRCLRETGHHVGGPTILHWVIWNNKLPVLATVLL